MAKGNILVNGFTGKLGNMVFAKVNGQEVARGYNPAPKVSYTTPQCLQRGKMKTLVLMWQRLTGGQSFKFAFGDKKAKQSDFNRFVQLNMLSAPVSFPNSYWVSNSSFTWQDAEGQRHELQDGQIPAFGVVSQGSVCSVQGTASPSQGTTGAIYSIDTKDLWVNGIGDPSNTSVTQFKDDILSNNSIGLQVGDKVTIIGVYPGKNQPTFTLQLILGVEQQGDDQFIGDLGIAFDRYTTGIETLISPAASEAGIFSMTIIVSRKDYVSGVSKQNQSTSYMCLSPGAEKLVAAMKAEEYQTAVAKAWGESVSLLQSV